MRILLAEDDPSLAMELTATLEEHGFVVDVACTGDEAIFLGTTEQYDAALTDLGLPAVDGLRVINEWRRKGLPVPVLVITARSSWSDKAAGFEAGADDYLTKPFLAAEIVARLRALIRRANGHPGNRISCGPLVLDVQTGSFTLDGGPLALTAFESRLLSALMLRKGKVMERARLAECAYHYGSDLDFKSMEVVLGRIRRKIGADLIRTVRNQGYVLDEPLR